MNILYYMNISKYKWKLRIILVESNNIDYKKIIKEYKEYKYEFHKRFLKLIILKNDKYKLKIKLIGFDGKIKKKFKQFNRKNIFDLVDEMPMGKLKNNKIKPINLSLYEDYNPKTTIKGLGFKNKKKALETINKIKHKDLSYQKRVINTMLNRAKYHPYINNDMKEAIIVFKKWIKNN